MGTEIAPFGARSHTPSARPSTRSPTATAVPVSAGLLTDTERCFDALTAYRSGDIQSIVERFAEAGFDSVVDRRQLVAELRAVRAAWTSSIT